LQKRNQQRRRIVLLQYFPSQRLPDIPRPDPNRKGFGFKDDARMEINMGR